jgi:hypothetical protein
MFTLTLGCLVGAVEYSMLGTTRAVWLALIAIVVGSVATFVRRLSLLASELETR